MRLHGLLGTALVAVLIPGTALGADDPQGIPRPSIPATRAEVLAGEASPPRTFELLKASIEAAGGQAVQATAEEALGGFSYPLLSVDLDGDGNEETLLEQYIDRPYLVAVDRGRVLWRARMPKRASVVGTFTADFAADGGQEVLLFLFKWGGDGAIFLTAGREGVLWRSSEETYWFEPNGIVQADDDPQSELAITVYDDSTLVKTFDGEDGSQLMELRSSLERTTGVEYWTEAFVTDGVGDAPDEAVFVSDLRLGLYAERQSLASGQRLAFNVLPAAEQHILFQAPDHTGDGRRDGFMSSPFLFQESFGVFDPSTLTIAWTREIPVPAPETWRYSFPVNIGDSNGDGSQDVCLQIEDISFDEEGERITESSTSFRCFKGSSGADLWQATASVEMPDKGWGWASGSAFSDLDGDGAIDPVLESRLSRCVDSGETTTCEHSYEAVAHSGGDGSVLWEIANNYGPEWDLGGADLDAVPGDDMIRAATAPSKTGAHFGVINGHSLALKWFGTVQTPGPYTYVTFGIDPDLDGDGTAEAVMTAQDFVGVGEPICHVWDGQEFCWYDEYEEHTYIAAFNPQPGQGYARLLWQLEL